MAITGPCRPFWMLTWQAAMEGESIGTMNGLTRLPPCSRKTRSPERHVADAAAAGVDDHRRSRRGWRR